MSVRVIASDSMSVMYDSTSDTAFGPVFYTAEGAGNFLAWYSDTDTIDLRLLSEQEVAEWVAKYHTAMAALDVEGIRYCPVCGGSDGEHDWETHTAEIRATSDD